MWERACWTPCLYSLSLDTALDGHLGPALMFVVFGVDDSGLLSIHDVVLLLAVLYDG